MPHLAQNNPCAGNVANRFHRFADDNSDEDLSDSLAGFIANARQSMADRARNRDADPGIFRGEAATPCNSALGDVNAAIARTHNAARLVTPRRLSANSTMQRADMFARHYLGVEAREHEAEGTPDRLLFTGYVRNLQLAGPGNSLFRAYRLPDTAYAHVDPLPGDSTRTTNGSVNYSIDEVDEAYHSGDN